MINFILKHLFQDMFDGKAMKSEDPYKLFEYLQLTFEEVRLFLRVFLCELDKLKWFNHRRNLLDLLIDIKISNFRLR